MELHAFTLVASRGSTDGSRQVGSPCVLAPLWFRIAVKIAVGVTRYCFSYGCSTEDFENTYRQYRGYLEDVTASPEEISAAFTDSIALATEGTGGALVTDYVAPFELRKLHWRLSRAPAGRIEDVDVCTFHFIKVSGGAPAAWNDATDLAAIEADFTTFVAAIRASWFPFTHSDQYRWYKDGPAFYALNGDGTAYVPVGDNPAIRVTEVDVAGLAADSACLPPQVAMSVTEVTSARKHWGRFYLPQQSPGLLDATGLLKSSTITTVMTPAMVFYNARKAAGTPVCVFCIPKPVRHTSSGSSLVADLGHAYEVTALQMDDIPDIIRSRRYKSSVTKTRTALT